MKGTDLMTNYAYSYIQKDFGKSVDKYAKLLKKHKVRPPDFSSCVSHQEKEDLLIRWLQAYFYFPAKDRVRVLTAYDCSIGEW